jgi:tRNA(fMet)-specific endonuclease VapC
MRLYSLDTGSAGDYVYRRGQVYNRARQRKALGDRVGICMPVLGELWYGVERSHDPPKHRRHLVRELTSLRIWPFDMAAAREFGRLAALLKGMGRPMQQLDIQIAAVALTLRNCTLVTKDSDFQAIPGVTVEDWSV